MEFTGERVVPGKTDPDLMNEHWARYQFAKPLVHGKLVVDAGCGVGYGSAFLAASARLVLALDTSTEALRAAREEYSHPKVALINADCGRLPLPDASVDVVASFEVIEHLNDWQSLISEAARVLAPHGQLLVSTPNRIYSQESRQEPNPYHVHEFDYSEFESELGKYFPYVMLFLENHSDAVTFIPPQGEDVRTRLEGRERDPQSAHFFLAVCSKQPQHGPPAFVFVPSGGNVLREREQHVKALQEQVHELEQHITTLQEQVRELEQENAERTRWAQELNMELESVRVDRTKLIERLDETEQRVIERSDWAMSLDRELKETQQHLAFLKQSLVFRISRRTGLIRDPKTEDDPMT